jgi:PII-like signaling protein
MNRIEVTVVRIYISEGHAQLDNLMKRLHDWEKVKGVSVFRGIEGFGDSGKFHTGKLMDLSLDLPLVVEFFDLPEKVETILEHLEANIKPGHMLSWNAWVNESEQETE